MSFSKRSSLPPSKTANTIVGSVRITPEIRKKLFDSFWTKSLPLSFSQSLKCFWNRILMTIFIERSVARWLIFTVKLTLQTVLFGDWKQLIRLSQLDTVITIAFGVPAVLGIVTSLLGSYFKPIRLILKLQIILPLRQFRALINCEKLDTNVGSNTKPSLKCSVQTTCRNAGNLNAPYVFALTFARCLFANQILVLVDNDFNWLTMKCTNCVSNNYAEMGQWWWSSGQFSRLVLRRFEFEFR